MIATIIVTLSLVLAGIYTLAWICKPSLRRQIEEPKYGFQEQVHQYNRQCHSAPKEVTRCPDES
jgi:hypothetical protein